MYTVANAASTSQRCEEATACAAGSAACRWMSSMEIVADGLLGAAF
jgi:hypothetical protein